MRSSASPRQVKKAAIDELTVNVVDGVRSGDDTIEVVVTQIPMRKSADAPADVVDMTDFNKLDAHARSELNLEPSPLKMPLSFMIEIAREMFPGNPIKFNITNPSVLYALRREFEKMTLGEVQSTPSITMTVTKKALLILCKESPSRKGKHKAEEALTNELSTLLYGAGFKGRQHLEAEWTPQCDYFMAKNKVGLPEAPPLKPLPS